jgi:hypothetical protein
MTNLLNTAGVIGLARSDSDAYVPQVLLLAGSFPIETSEGILLDPAADTPEFTLVGRITSSGKLTLSNPGASDGSQVPVGITTAFAKEAGADQPITFYRTGKFNYNRINKHASWTLVSLRIAMETRGSSLFFDIPATATPSSP